MAQYTAKNPNTGESVTFEWKGPKPPTPDDVDRISEQQREGRARMREQQKANEPSFMDKILMSKPVSMMQDALEAVVPKEMPWESIPAGLSQMGRGLKQVATGQGPEATAKWGIHGAVDIGEGAMRAASFPLEVMGLATNPGATLAGFEGAHFAGPLVQRGIEAVAPNAPPELKQAGTDIGTLAA